jgi:site-specific recombinase XerD
VDDQSEVVPQTSLSKASADYLDEIAAHKSKKTFAAYSLTLKLFQQCCSKRHLEDIERKDILNFMSFLKDMKNGPRTVLIESDTSSASSGRAASNGPWLLATNPAIRRRSSQISVPPR